MRKSLTLVFALVASLAYAADRPETVEIGKLAPKLSVGQWRSASEKERNLDDLAGKVVLLDFWGVWDATCRASLPKVVKLSKDYKEKGVVVIGVHTKLSADKLADVADKEKLEFPLCVDENGETVKAYKVKGFPLYVLIDKKGIVRSSSHSTPAPEEIDKLVGEN
jgi:peroxiredoxin